MNIKYGIGKVFGSRERAYCMGVNAQFGPRQINRPCTTPNYGPVKSKFEVYYYRHTYCYPEKVAHIKKELEKLGQEVIYSSKCFNSNYMEVVGYETREILIFTSVEGRINKNTISKQGITDNNINTTSPSSTLGFFVALYH